MGRAVVAAAVDPSPLVLTAGGGQPPRSGGRSSPPSAMLPTVPGSPPSFGATDNNEAPVDTSTIIADAGTQTSPVHQTKTNGRAIASTIMDEQTAGNKSCDDKTENQSGNESNKESQQPKRRLQDGMATALSLDHWTAPPTSQCNYPLAPELSVNFLCMHPPPGTESDASGPHLPTAARFQEIFVDLCALYASSYDAASRHVLDSRFDSFLGPGEREFKRAVLDLVRGGLEDGSSENGDSGRAGGLSAEARNTSAYRRLERMLKKEMGLGTLDERQEMRVRKMRGLRRESASASALNTSANSGLASALSSTSLGSAASSVAEQEIDESSNMRHVVSSISLATSGSSSASNGKGILAEDDEKEKDDPRADALRDLIMKIRYDDDLFRQFSLIRDDDALTEAVSSLLPHSIREGDFADMISLERHDDASIQLEAQAFCRLLSAPGHVFVINGSVCDLSCDAFLCPCSISLKKDTVAGTIFKRWYEALQETNANLLNILKGPDDIRSSTGRAQARRRRSRSRSSSAGSDDEMGQGRSGSRAMFSTIPMKRYEKYDRVVTPKHWPWADFWRKDAFEAATGGVFRVPFIIAGEVSIERSFIGGSKKAVPSEQDHIDALIETVRQFVLVALEELRREQPRPRANRERYLLALPVVGSGYGGAGDITGQIVEAMMMCLSELVASNTDVDCVLCCADLATFSHAQNLRYEMYERLGSNSDAKAKAFHSVEPLSSFRLFTQEMRENARELAKLSSKQTLSMFLGAGVSMASGLPSWKQLLLAIEDQFTQTGKPEERMLGRGVDPLLVADWLDVLCQSRADRNGRKAGIKERIADFLKERSGYPSLLCFLLASLPCKSLVTQNYDCLIEGAFELRNVAEKKSAVEVGEEAAAAESLSVIPYRPVKGAGRWLLKMHGCVSNPESIVVTSADYRSYENGRKKALAGLVQANLLTSHILFVGFGLADPNYHKILAEVRKAMGKSSD